LETYSRRQFLKLSGITLAGSLIGFPSLSQRFAAESGYPGRALAATPIYRARHLGSAIVGTLWPDSMTPILDTSDGWYRTAKGYVQRESLQPMTPYLPKSSPQLPDTAFWGEVAGPAAPVRQYCAADAPFVTRIGHGGVAQVVDYLPGEPNGWYGVGDGTGQFLGWTQAIYWQAVDDNRFEAGEPTLEIDLIAQRLTVRENGNVILEAPCSTNQSLHRGIYTVQQRKPCGTQFDNEHSLDAFHGVPWIIRLEDDHDLAGVYWHNRFGKEMPGPAIQVTPLLAHWLYGWLQDSSRIDVV